MSDRNWHDSVRLKWCHGRTLCLEFQIINGKKWKCGEKGLTFGEGHPSLPGGSCWDTRPRRPDSAGGAGWLGRRNLSKMAMTRNMEMRMAVATNPKDTALTELSKLRLPQERSSTRCCCCKGLAGAPSGDQVGCPDSAAIVNRSNPSCPS